MVRRSTLILALATAGCLRPPPDCIVDCHSGDTCPDPLVCVAGLCVHDGGVCAGGTGGTTGASSTGGTTSGGSTSGGTGGTSGAACPSFDAGTYPAPSNYPCGGDAGCCEALATGVQCGGATCCLDSTYNPLADGAPFVGCFVPEDCCAGTFCNGTASLCEQRANGCGQPGDCCNSGADCCQGESCGTQRDGGFCATNACCVPLGQPCTGPQDCCGDRACGSAGNCCTPDGRRCGQDTDCCPGSACGSLGFCRACPTSGSACGASGCGPAGCGLQCCNGICISSNGPACGPLTDGGVPPACSGPGVCCTQSGGCCSGSTCDGTACCTPAGGSPCKSDCNCYCCGTLGGPSFYGTCTAATCNCLVATTATCGTVCGVAGGGSGTGGAPNGDG